jgi:hypothetical protein
MIFDNAEQQQILLAAINALGSNAFSSDAHRLKVTGKSYLNGNTGINLVTRSCSGVDPWWQL